MVTVAKIKELFNEMFQEQQKHISKIIESNNKMLTKNVERLTEKVDELVDRCNTLQKGYDDMQLSLEACQDIYEKKIQQIEKKVAEHENAKNEELASIKNKLRVMEDRSRRNNLRVDGVKENDSEKWNETEAKVQKIFEDIGVDNVKIERAHRVGGSTSRSNDRKPRTIVMKLLDFKDKERIMENSNRLKGTNIFINEDFSAETVKIRKDLIEKMRDQRAKGKYATLSYDKLIVREFRKKVN